MRIVIAGATGLIGRALCERTCRDYEIIALSRHPEKSRLDKNITVVQWDAKSQGRWGQYIDGAFAVINLAGENIAAGRWTGAKMQRILQSRVNAAKAIVDTIASAKEKPAVLVQASATGFYGCREESLDETGEKGDGFLAEVCEKWERQAGPVERFGTRCVIIRTGVVLSRDGGALPRMATPFKFFAGGYPGTGKQWVSWITIDDEAAAIKFLVESPRLSGVFNLVSPNPVTMKTLCRTIGEVMKRPCRLPVPALALKVMFGKMADETLLCSQRVLPGRLLKAGFKFAGADLEEALTGIFRKVQK